MTTYHIQRQSVPYTGSPYSGPFSCERNLSFSNLDATKHLVRALRSRGVEWCIWDADTKQIVFGVDLFKKKQKALKLVKGNKMTTYHIQRQSVPYTGEPYKGKLSLNKTLQFSRLDTARTIVIRLRERAQAEWCIWDADTKELVLGVDLFKRTQKA